MENRAECNREDFAMTKPFLRLRVFAAGMLLIMVSATRADEICTDKMEFEKNGWKAVFPF